MKPEICQTPLWSPDECAALAASVKALHPFWIPRPGFYTLGAATYQDPPDTYPALAAYTNLVLWRHFYGLPEFTKLREALQTLYDTPVLLPLYGHPQAAVPGFHVFNDRSNQMVGSLHVDEPYDRLLCLQHEAWEKPGSFTVPLELPCVGGGLNVWDTDHDPQVHAPDYLPYACGVLYSHDGQFYHQIANPGPLSPQCYRITLQGHSVYLTDRGETLVYF